MRPLTALLFMALVAVPATASAQEPEYRLDVGKVQAQLEQVCGKNEARRAEFLALEQDVRRLKAKQPPVTLEERLSFAELELSVNRAQMELEQTERWCGDLQLQLDLQSEFKRRAR